MGAGERYAFIVEWLDPHAGLTFKYQLMYHLADGSIEMYDIKNRRTFLKRVVYPSVKVEHLYIGSTITVYSRQLKITEYSDDYTRKQLVTTRQSTFMLVKPKAIGNMGKIMNAVCKSGFVVAKLKMVKMSESEAASVLSAKKEEAGFSGLVSELASGPSLGLELVAEDAVEKFSELLGPADGSTPNTICAHFGPACVSSSDAESVVAEVGKFFSLKTYAELKSSTLCLVKPSAILYTGLVMDAILEKFKIAGAQMFHLDRANAMEFYEVYKGVVPEYMAMVNELTSGPFIALEVASLDGQSPVEAFRELVGPMDPEIATVLRPSSLRAQFGYDKVKNAVHCTDLAEDGPLETNYFFSILQG